MVMTNQQTLKEVQSAIESIEEARSNSELNKNDRYILELSLQKLSSIEQAIIRGIGEDMMSKLMIETKELNNLVAKIDKSSETLEGVVIKIDKASELVNVVIKAFTVGSKLG